LRILLAGIQCSTPDLRDRRDIGRAALPALDLDGADPDALQFRQQRQGIQADGFLYGIAGPAAGLETALAECRVAGSLVMAEAVDQDIAQAGFHAVRGFPPLHRAGWRAGAVGVGRAAGDIGRQQAATLHHDAQAAEAEDLERDRAVLRHHADLPDGQHPWQHGAPDVEVLVVETDRLGTGCGALYGKVQSQAGPVPGRVVHDAGVGEYQGIDAECCGLVHGRLPARPACRLREGVDGDGHPGVTRTGIADALGEATVIEVQPREVARVGVIAEAAVHGIGAMVDRGFQCGQVAGRADKFHAGDSGETVTGCWRCNSLAMRLSTSHFFEHHSGASRMLRAAVAVTR
jgi:hypothetical protein